MKWENQYNKIMLSKLVRGERAAGKYSKIKHEPNVQNESCVFQLADFKPSDLKYKSNKAFKQSMLYQDTAKDALLRADDKRRNRLDNKMTKVVHEA